MAQLQLVHRPALQQQKQASRGQVQIAGMYAAVGVAVAASTAVLVMQHPMPKLLGGAIAMLQTFTISQILSLPASCQMPWPFGWG